MNAYAVALQNNIYQLDEIREMEDKPPLGFNYVKLGLDTVLLDLKTGQIYTPNTDKMTMLNTGNILTSESKDDIIQERGNTYHDDKGRFTSADEIAVKTFKSDMISHKNEIIADFKTSGFNGDIHIPPAKIEVSSLVLDQEHIDKRGHKVTAEQARKFIQDAGISYSKTVNGIEFENYIGIEGASYVIKAAKEIRTAFGKSEFTKGTERFFETLGKCRTKE